MARPCQSGVTHGWRGMLGDRSTILSIMISAARHDLFELVSRLCQIEHDGQKRAGDCIGVNVVRQNNGVVDAAKVPDLLVELEQNIRNKGSSGNRVGDFYEF